MKDFLVRGSLSEIDPEVEKLIKLETERQFRKLILIPSESSAPAAVRESMGSVFQNLYAEGYPDEDTRWLKEDEILDYPTQLGHFRRYGDPRYYKGMDYVNIVEELARRRAAEAFATPKVSADQIYVNIQPLSGAPANNAVYTALIKPGDTILGMNLLHGGHLSHGSSVNRSGMLYNVVHYNVDPETEKIDYDKMQELANEHKPKIIIAGYSSYPWIPDWKRYREIADSVGAYLLADISHIAGLVAGGVVPSPVGFAHVITFTTHKTLCGPRGAVILTQSPALSKKIDKAVFPGEQGGPHVHIFTALATTFKIAQTPGFKQLQAQILKNTVALTKRLQERGMRIPFGGTDTHLGNVDCRTITGENGVTLSGDLGARILDIAGIVVNRNTIPGDKTALYASGIRFGTPWITQRGFKEEDTVKVADIMADVLLGIKPYPMHTRKGEETRAKIDFELLENAKLRVRELAESAGFDGEKSHTGYPHFYYIDDEPRLKSGWVAFDLKGENIRSIVNYVFTSDAGALKPGQSQKTNLVTDKEKLDAVLTCIDPFHFKVTVSQSKAGLAAAWLRDLSDGYISFDPDLQRRIPGAFEVTESTAAPYTAIETEMVSATKPYYIGLEAGKGEALPKFKWVEPENVLLKRTPLYEVHKKLGAKIIPFAGWEMPVWYTSVLEEHLATRQAAGLFDVSHMAVYQAEGPDAEVFLDSVCANDIGALKVGESLYTHLLDTDANVIDDLLVYRRGVEKYLVVVNASNDDKDWAWLKAVREGKVMVDPSRPYAKAFGCNVNFRNLKDPAAGDEMRVDIALQGRKSRDILLALGVDAENKARIMALQRTQLCEAEVGGIDLVVSRTGYTGENMAFELFVHPDRAVELWNGLMKVGEPMGLKPIGLGARDSLRTEFGLPLYGDEMGGVFNLGVSEAGFGSYVKTYKPWFIGREAYIKREAAQKGIVVRFRFEEKRTRMAHHGNPIVDSKGKVIGKVTSCAIDSDGYLTGQAFVDEKYSEEGTELFIFQSASDKAEKAAASLDFGDKITLPSLAIVVSRFAKLK
ncbi:MAG: glycine cleavage system aminomethyltransferase GcvT [Chloroflexi bacterium]|nr:glycine cleavage system aminomethyltransferase GcvT [Chloroflexota bacterium]